MIHARVPITIRLGHHLRLYKYTSTRCPSSHHQRPAADPKNTPPNTHTLTWLWITHLAHTALAHRIPSRLLQSAHARTYVRSPLIPAQLSHGPYLALITSSQQSAHLILHYSQLPTGISADKTTNYCIIVVRIFTLDRDMIGLIDVSLIWLWPVDKLSSLLHEELSQLLASIFPPLFHTVCFSPGST